MRVTAKVDYAIRALVELAAAGPGSVKGDTIASAQEISIRFLENIMLELKRAGLVATQRGAEGGYRLAKPAGDISVADVIRALEGPIANVRGIRPEELVYHGPSEPLRELWIAVRANLRAILEHTTIADIASGTLPDEVLALTRNPDAWARRA